MPIAAARTKAIEEFAMMVNKASEKYQLIHATFAIEKLFQEKMSRESNARVIELRNQLKEENDPERQKQIHLEAKELQKGEDKRIRILVNYISISQLPETSARIAKTPNNTFIISLPKSLENVRNPDGAINFEKIKQLRELMAHELGHIVLHTGIFQLDGAPICVPGEEEEEAEFFAQRLLELRRERNSEIYNVGHYKKI